MHSLATEKDTARASELTCHLGQRSPPRCRCRRRGVWVALASLVTLAYLFIQLGSRNGVPVNFWQYIPGADQLGGFLRAHMRSESYPAQSLTPELIGTIRAGVKANDDDPTELAFSNAFSDYNKYVWHKELSDWDPASNHRIIAIGDIHGMVDSLQKLLQQVKYDAHSDTVVLVGDLAAKHPSIKSSLETIRYCRQSGFEAVRGNHDQYVIIWRNWMEMNRKPFIKADQLAQFESDIEATLESDGWLQADEPSRELKKKLPEGMKWKSQHFEIARRLPKVDFEWLLARSLTLYLHPLRTYFVHAGLLPWSPPTSTDFALLKKPTPLLKLKENKDPYTLIEMRRLKDGKKPTKSKHKGEPWYKYWNKAMEACDQLTAKQDRWCEESYNVVYGHWAAKGLKIKPWSTGLDSGCVYGRALSALVVGEDRSQDGHDTKKFPVAIRGVNATVVQLPCPKP